MKKILFATTALVATAGIAAAEVSLGGGAEIGIFYDGTDPDQFHTDVDVDFDMSGEADNGLTFGASVDLDEARNTGFDPSDDEGVSYFIAYGGARLAMGDTDGALDLVIEDVALGGGSIQDNETTHTGFNSDAFLDGTGDGQIATFSYSMNGFTGAFSVEQGTQNGGGDEIIAFGVRYETEVGHGTTLGFGLGIQSQDNGREAIAVSVDGAFDNGLRAGIQFSETSGAAGEADETHYGIGMAYTVNALTIGMNYGSFENKGNTAGNDVDGFGLAVVYDFGGGLEAQFGYASNDGSNDTYSLGLAMSF